MKIFNWIFSAFFRTLGRFLFYILIGLIAMLFISGKVNAQTYQINPYESIQYFFHDPSASDFTQTGIYGQNSTIMLYHDYYYSGFSFKAELSTESNSGILYPGTYLIDFYMYANNSSLSSNYDCSKVESNFKNVNMTTGNWVSNEISSSCVNVYRTTYNGLDAYHFLYKFVYKGANTGSDSINELEFYVNPWGFSPHFQGNVTYTYGAIAGNISDYSSDIVDNFNQTANQITTNNKLDTQINQNQTIIDQNNQTNNKLDDLKDKLTSTQGADLGSLQNSAGWLPAGPVDSILNLPLSLLNNLTTNLNKSCQPVILPIPYVNKNLTLPCVNTLYDSMGISAWVTTIGVIASAFIMFSYLVKLYKWVDDTLSFRENNSIDNWGGI